MVRVRSPVQIWVLAPLIQFLLGDHSIVDPPDSMPNSVVKRNSADGSVGFPHARVGHCQIPLQTRSGNAAGFFVSALLNVFLTNSLEETNRML